MHMVISRFIVLSSHLLSKYCTVSKNLLSKRRDVNGWKCNLFQFRFILNGWEGSTTIYIKWDYEFAFLGCGAIMSGTPMGVKTF